jgi:hypothetical protein
VDQSTYANDVDFVPSKIPASSTPHLKQLEERRQSSTDDGGQDWKLSSNFRGGAEVCAVPAGCNLEKMQLADTLPVAGTSSEKATIPPAYIGRSRQLCNSKDATNETAALSANRVGRQG